ncbi:tigger transposable element-derived protein 1-like [Neodiprion pinetum]|uniref:tigger transposable element-derived protein 1-like n=1 Tax=Neodiprion pinetum TaxID=441929 RepID=UPI003723A0A1
MAAAAYGVPVATLARKKNVGPEKAKNKTGPDTVLSPNEEDNIVQWVLYRASMGAPVTKTELLDCVQRYVQTMEIKTPFTDNRPSRHWYEGFRKRHPELSIRKPQHLSTSRAAVNREELQEWFKDSGKYLESKNLLNIPASRIFNCDESSILLCPDAESVLAEKGSRAVYKIVDGGKESLTVLFTYRADRTRAPPMLMYSYKKSIPKKIVENTPTGWGLGVSDSGWMTTETFYEYITNVFYPWLLEEKTEFPVILYMDNHSSHLNLPLVTFCREKQIELVMLPPNSTHIMQPLDISFFHPFKETWKKCVPKWKNEHGVGQIKKEDFPQVLKFTLDSMKNEKSVVVSGFKGAGLYPFDSNAVDYDILQKNKKSKKTVDRLDNNSADRNEENQQFLLSFEKNLPKDMLSEFKEAAKCGSWSGDLEKKALFDYWFKISNYSTGI